jgi:hypothetical protein
MVLMKSKIMPIAFSILSMLLFASSASAFVSLTFSSITTPATIQPGTQGTLLLTISNTGTDFAGTPQFIVQSSSYVTASTAIFNLASINAGGSTTVTIPITISPSAPEGSVTLPFTIAYTIGTTSGSVTTNNGVTLTVTKRTLIQVTDVSYSENVIQPGDTFTMNITLQNVGSAQIKDLDVSIRNFSSIVVPAAIDTEKIITSLSPGESNIINFDLIALPSSAVGPYSIPISLTYYDDQGNLHNDIKFAGLKISGIPDFVVSLENTNIYAGQTNMLSVDIANVGTGSAKFVTVYADSNQNVLPKVSYIGNLDPDDSSTISLNLFSNKAGPQSLNITIRYKDAYNQQYQETKIVQFNATTVPIQISNNMLIIIAVVVIGVLYWKRHAVKRLLKRK